MVRGQLKVRGVRPRRRVGGDGLHELEADWGDDGCYSTLIDKNTGVLAVRATPNGSRRWLSGGRCLAVGQKDEQDQTTFMDLLDGNGCGPLDESRQRRPP